MSLLNSSKRERSGPSKTGICLPLSQERELELQKEQRRQEENDKLRQEFAQHANA